MATLPPDEQALFEVARKLGTREAREAYLQQVCGDAAIAKRIRTLLDAYDESASFLESPAAALEGTVEAPAVADASGTVIGPYKLLQQIGEGGMGTVYMAEQLEPVRRKVAVKVVKPGMDSKQVVARFEAERQALAMMDHVNIARVFDGGATEVGRPYFVMELVHGVPITRYCDDNHLTPRQRLELFLPVCQAIQHAHHKGIIHRDVKPSNVLVTLYDGQPGPKVIDFGIAKAIEQRLTERTLFTNYGTMVGTVEYMSPEQAEMSALGVDTRSDIYSLGVLLYELLTGSTPLSHERIREASYADILRMIKEEEPPRPSTRLSDSGEALASISANRHTEPAKLTKLVRGELDWIVMKTLEKDRNRRYETAGGFAADVQRYLNDEPVLACPPSAAYRFKKFARRNKAALAFTGLILLILLTLTGGIGWNVRDRAARQTLVDHAVSVALKEAEQLQEQTKWPEALSAAKRAEGLLAGSGSEELRDRVRQLRKDLELVLRLEEIPLLRSELKDNKYDHEAADRAYAQAFADHGIDVARLPAEEAGAHIRARTGVAVALAAALDDWAYCKAFKGKAGFSALTAVAQAADPDPWRRQVREANRDKDSKVLGTLAASPELSRQAPTTVRTLAWALRRVGLEPERIEMLRRAQRQYPGDFWINVELAADLARMGLSYRDEVVAFRRAALAVRPHSAAVHNDLGAALNAQGKVDEAVACYRKAIELGPKAAHPYHNLGSALAQQGLLDQAVEAYHKAIRLNPKSVKTYILLGDALGDLHKLPEAIVAYRKAIELDPKDSEAYNHLGIVLSNQKKLVDAIDAFQQAIKRDPKNANAYNNLGRALYYQQKLPEAIAAYQQAIKLEPKGAPAYSNLALALVKLGDPEKLPEAIAAAEKAIELDPKFANAYNVLGLALAAQNKLDAAAAAYQKAIDLDPKHDHAHSNLGTVFGRQGKFDQAIACCRKALEINPKHDTARHTLGIALGRKGWQLVNNPDPKLREPKRAVELAKEGVELAPSVERWQVLGWVRYRAGNWKASIEALEKSCELDKGGNSGQWIVMSLAHGKLAIDKDLNEEERTRHKAEARRWYDQAAKQIAGLGPGDAMTQAIRAFRAEAATLLGVQEKPK